MHLILNLAIVVLSGSTIAAPTTERAEPLGQLYIADYGVGHRSRPVTRWRTSLRELNTDSGSANTIIEFGKPTTPAEPIGATSLALDQENKHAYVATGEGIIRTDLSGSNPVTILNEGEIINIHGNKIFYGTQYDGLVKRANLDGSDVEIFLNVSQGINFGVTPTYTPANSFPAGIAIDEENGFIYWSASRGPDNGSVRRAPLKAQPGSWTPENEEILVEHINMPGQLRLVNGYLYWAEEGRWSNSPTSLKRAQFPTSKIEGPGAIVPDTLVHSNQYSVFFESDGVDNNTLAIKSFVVDEENERVWLAIKSDNRVMFGKILETGLDGQGLTVRNANVTEVGIPMGIEHVG